MTFGPGHLGREFSISGIPSVVTIDHSDVYHYWEKSRIKSATLLHVDAHADMDKAPAKDVLKTIGEANPNDYYKLLGIGCFICPAFHYGILSSIYWLNPHYPKATRLQYMGSSLETDPMRLKTVVKKAEYHGGIKIAHYYSGGNGRNHHQIFFKARHLKNLGEASGKPIKIKECHIDSSKPFILDIDMDAFSCRNDLGRNVQSMPRYYDGNGGFEKRVSDTLQFLSRFRKPDFISISQSVGLQELYYALVRGDASKMILNHYHSIPFVNRDVVGKLEDILVKGLENIYA